MIHFKLLFTFIFFVYSQLEIQTLKLGGPLNNSDSEISGLAWYSDKLVILPQYPQKHVLGSDALYSIKKSDLLMGIKDSTTLVPKQIPFELVDIDKKIDGFEGFEAICFYENHVYLTIETSHFGNMGGWVIRGIVKDDLSSIQLEVNTLSKIPMNQQIKNMSYESMFYYQDHIYVIYEANGKNVNAYPKVHIYDLDLNYISNKPIDIIDYRITDVSEVSNHSFWAINYMWPGENDLLNPVIKSDRSIERVVKYSISEDGIQYKKSYSIKTMKESRNWEGLVVLDTIGFILATDKYPETILGFIRF